MDFMQREAPAKPLRIWRAVRKYKETCSFGKTHDVEVWGFKDVFLAGHYDYNNGYELRSCGIYEDRDGNQYRECITIDYYSNVFFRQGDYTWYLRPRTGSHVNVDLTGKVLK